MFFWKRKLMHLSNNALRYDQLDSVFQFFCMKQSSVMQLLNIIQFFIRFPVNSQIRLSTNSLLHNTRMAPACNWQSNSTTLIKLHWPRRDNKTDTISRMSFASSNGLLQSRLSSSISTELKRSAAFTTVITKIIIVIVKGASTAA